MMRAKVAQNEAGVRFDVYVSTLHPTLSRSLVKKLIEEGRAKVNNVIEKPGYKLRQDDRVSFYFNAKELLTPQEISLPVIYEDGDCLVIDKPSGVLTHSKGALNAEATIESFITSKLKGLTGNRAGIVHRLDRATSGVIICARTDVARAWLQKQFSSRKVKKTYFAVIAGQLDPPVAVIDMPIERNPRNPKSFRVGKEGKEAITEYQTVECDAYSLVKLLPKTGRTHQLRVHLKQLGHPIVGDDLYGGDKADRLYLHAYSLEITLPNRERKIFISDLPKSFSEKVHQGNG